MKDIGPARPDRLPRTPNGTNGPTGYAENLLTKDGQKLRISYGTASG